MIGSVKTGNDVHGTNSRTRVILTFTRIGAFLVEITGGFSPRTIQRLIALLGHSETRRREKYI
jgi:hypothetical protein